MTDFEINDYILQKEAHSIAECIIDECKDDDLAELYDRAWEYADGHQWVIYTYKALQLCANCRTDDGEQWLEDNCWEFKPSFSEIVSQIAFAELHCRIMDELATITDGVVA